MKRYVLLAGVNGDGKSTLFSLISLLSEIEKINLYFSNLNDNIMIK